MKGTWETTEGSGSGLGTVVLIIVAAALLGPAVGAAAMAVAAAVAELVHIVLIIVAVLAGLGAAGLVGLLVFRARRRLEDAARAVPPNLGAVSPLHRTARAARPSPSRGQRSRRPGRCISTSTASRPGTSPPSSASRDRACRTAPRSNHVRNH